MLHLNQKQRAVGFGVSAESYLSGKMVPMVLRKAIGGLYALLYCLTVLFLKDYLPQNLFNDSQKMYQHASMGYADSSFAVTGRIFMMFPLWSHSIVVMIVGLFCIRALFKEIRSWRGLCIGCCILTPMLILCGLIPSKETLIIIMTLVLLTTARGKKSGLFLIISVVAFYVLYGSYIRTYYWLILGVWLILIAKPAKTSVVFVCTAILIGCVGLFFVPERVFQELQGSRDHVQLFITYMSPNNAIRTGFGNPFVPNNAFAFIGNYLYAAVFLHLPVLFFWGGKELLLFINELMYAWLAVRGCQSQDKKTNLLTKLFLSHVVVLLLFEPDLGSYFRHFSSVFLYLLPAFAFMEQKFLQGVRREKNGNALMAGRNGVSGQFLL